VVSLVFWLNFVLFVGEKKKNHSFTNEKSRFHPLTTITSLLTLPNVRLSLAGTGAGFSGWAGMFLDSECQCRGASDSESLTRSYSPRSPGMWCKTLHFSAFF